MSGITGRRIASSSKSSGSSSGSNRSSTRSNKGRPPKIGRHPQQIIDASKVEAPEGIWSYFTPSERERLRNRSFHPEDFHVAVSDDNGHDVKKQIRFHPMMMNELAMFVSRGNFPVDNVDDIVRSGTFWFMGIMYALEKKIVSGVPNPMPMLAAINRLAMAMYYAEAFDVTYERVKEQAKRSIAAGREKEAARFVYDVMEQIKAIPQKAYRQPALDRIKNDFGDLIRRNAKVVKVLKRSGDDGGRSRQRRNYLGGNEEGE